MIAAATSGRTRMGLLRLARVWLLGRCARLVSRSVNSSRAQHAADRGERPEAAPEATRKSEQGGVPKPLRSESAQSLSSSYARRPAGRHSAATLVLSHRHDIKDERL